MKLAKFGAMKLDVRLALTHTTTDLALLTGVMVIDGEPNQPMGKATKTTVIFAPNIETTIKKLLK